MTADEFRKMALAIKGAVESAHGGHPDFRVHAKVFASLGSPDDSWGMVKLSPDEQRKCIAAEPAAFKPCNGAWGKRGYTNVHLASISSSTLAAVLQAAARNVIPKPRAKA